MLNELLRQNEDVKENAKQINSKYTCYKKKVSNNIIRIDLTQYLKKQKNMHCVLLESKH